MSRMVHKMKNDRNVSHYVSNDMKYSYWLVQENHLIRYWKITGIVMMESFMRMTA